MNMLVRLQKKTLIPMQIIGYALTLVVGTAVLLIAFQAYCDLKILLSGQTDVLTPHAVTVSKNISVFNTINKDAIYFNDDELEELRSQDFIKEVAEFKSATFSPWAEFNGDNVGKLQTDLFFESVQDKYIDVQSEFWEWDSSANFLPIIIPEDFLNLYNFCFAESQSLPVISQNTMKLISFSIVVSGNGSKQTYSSRIVGFSNKIKTILVPEKFMDWANERFGNAEKKRTNRLLVEFRNANDHRIPAFFEQHGYAIDESELEYSKMSFFFNLAIVFVLVIAGIIIFLSMAFVVMSLNLIIQRNRKMLLNLYNIGYSPMRISQFYQIVVSGVTVIGILLAAFVALQVREIYLNQLEAVFDKPDNPVIIWFTASSLLLFMLITYNYLILKNIRQTVKG